jgi:hypothetical protein
MHSDPITPGTLFSTFQACFFLFWLNNLVKKLRKMFIFCIFMHRLHLNILYYVTVRL